MGTALTVTIKYPTKNLPRVYSIVRSLSITLEVINILFNNIKLQDNPSF